jgi:hypothetical protein
MKSKYWFSDHCGSLKRVLGIGRRDWFCVAFAGKHHRGPQFPVALPQVSLRLKEFERLQQPGLLYLAQCMHDPGGVGRRPRLHRVAHARFDKVLCGSRMSNPNPRAAADGC